MDARKRRERKGKERKGVESTCIIGLGRGNTALVYVRLRMVVECDLCVGVGM